MSRTDHGDQLSLDEQLFRILFNDNIESEAIVINLQAWFERHQQAVQRSKLFRQLQQVLSPLTLLTSEQQVLQCRNLCVIHLRKIEAAEHFPFDDLEFDPELAMFDESTDDMTDVHFPDDQTMSDAQEKNSLYPPSSAHHGNVSFRPNCRRWNFNLYT